MVLEKVVVHFLDKYLGDYIENFDAKKLKIDLWHGNVVLENLYLKPAALATLKLPVTLITGYLQKLSLHLSWSRLYTDPIKITIDGFYLLVEPDTEVKYDPEREKQEQYDAKMKEVHKVEEYQKNREEYEKSKRLPKHKDTFLERLELHLIRNLEVSISNVHIAFQDKTTKFDHPFAFGITLNYINFHTTNSNWEPVSSIDEAPVVYKVGELNTLSVYWNSNVKPRSNLSQPDLIDDLRGKIVNNDQTSCENMTYILPPSNMNVKLKLASKHSLKDFSQPILDAQVDLKEIHLNINRDQYSDLLDLLEVRDHLKLQSKYIKYYATIETAKPSLRRWKFACNVILNEDVRPRLAYHKWENIKMNLDQCREYHALYFKQLQHLATQKEKQRVQELEKQIYVFNLIFIRRMAQLEVKEKKAEEKETSWWNKLSNWWSENADRDNPDFDSGNGMTTDVKKNLYDTIGYEDDQKPSIYPEEYVDLVLSLRLDLLELNIWSNIDENKSQFQMITQGFLSDTHLTFQRRPSTSAFLITIDIDSSGMVGGDNEHRCTLIQPTHRKVLHVELETNPLNSNAHYRLHAESPSLEFIYDAVTINRLIECFHPGAHRKLKGVKKTAYSIYADITHRTQFLFNYNFRHIKALDVNVDLQPLYFVLPENGNYQKDCPAISLNSGHLTIQSGVDYIDQNDTKDFYEPDTDISYFPIKVRLANIRLIYAQSNEDWRKVDHQRDTSIYLIKPITLELDIFKCIYVDNAVLPLWKIDAQISAVDCRLSNTRILEMIRLIQSIPFPQLEEPLSESETIEELYSSDDVMPQKNTKKIFEKVENMIRTRGNSPETANTEEEEENDWKQVDSKVQFIELEAILAIPRIDANIEERVFDESNDIQPFVQISFVSITAQTTIKTFDVHFHASLSDFIIIHEKFLCSNNASLRLFSTDSNELLITVKCLFTSPENPLFYSDPYNKIENRIHLHMSQSLVLLQVEPLLSIFRFRDEIMSELAKQHVKTESKERPAKKSNSNNQVKKKNISAKSSYQIEGDLEQIRIIIGTENSQILDFQLQDLVVNVFQSARKTSVYLVLNNLHLLDLHTNTRYSQIIVQQDDSKEVLRAEIAKYNYSNIHEKTLNEVDWDVNIHLTKMNIVLLYRYVRLILNIMKKHNTSPKKTSTDDKTVGQFPETNLKFRFNVILDAPTIFIPINFHANEGVLVDLGELTLQTHFLDDPIRSFIEQQVFIFRNLSAHRVSLTNNNEIVGDIILLNCAEFYMSIDRLLQPMRRENEVEITVKIEWETIDMTISKDDYTCLMKIYRENFLEKIHPQSSPSSDLEQSNDEQTDDSIQNQKNLSNDQISEKIRLDFQMKKISLALFLDESNLNVRRAIRNENSKFMQMQIEMIEAHFQYLFDSSYHAEAGIQSFLLEDLRQTNLSESHRRLLERNIHIDRNTPMFMITVQFKPKTYDNAIAVREVNAQLESFSLSISPDCLMALKDFVTSSQSSESETKSQLLLSFPSSSGTVRDDLPSPAKPSSAHRQLNRQSNDPSLSIRTSSVQVSSNNKNNLQTRIHVLIKTSQILWLENPHDPKAKCFALEFTFPMRMIMDGGETQVYSAVKDLSIYVSNFTELKDSKIKYYILQPTGIDLVMMINAEQQKFDFRIGNIAIRLAPITIRSIINMANSIGKLRTTEPDTKEEINSKSLFDPKPFKDASFWFLEENEKNEKMIGPTDVLELTTGVPSQNKDIAKENKKQKQNQSKKIRTQQLIVKLKLMEVELALPSSSRTKAAVAICLSNLSLDVKNWSTDINISSTIQIELALFNDHLLAWEPLIDAITNERGEVISPWCITCFTIPKSDEDENEYLSERRSSRRRSTKLLHCLGHHPDSVSSSEEELEDLRTISHAKNKIHLRAEHLLGVTLTKTNIDLVQRLISMLTDVWNMERAIDDDDSDDESILSVHNLTGYQIVIDQLTGVEFMKSKKSETSVIVQHEESVLMTVPGERLSATHLPAIVEQIAQRRQQFSVKIDQDWRKVDINQTCQRVYELGPSFIPNWPIQLLCDSQISNYRRRVILSSVVKIYNRMNMPLILWDIESIEKKIYQRISRLEVNEEYYLPINFLYMRSSPRLFLGVDEYRDDSEEQLNDFISFDWANEMTVDRILKTKNNEEIHLVIYKESIEAYSENTDEPIQSCFHIYIKLALHLINLLPINVQCSIDNNDLIDLKPSELYQSIGGHKKSLLTFTIPVYHKTKWISEPVDLGVKGHGSHHEQIVQFNAVDTQQILRMILRVDTYRDSYRAALYAPFWIVNCTNVKFEFKIENEQTLIDAVNQPFLMCPVHFESKTHKKKGYIRVYSNEEDESVFQWSEGFPLHVLKNIGITNCKVADDRSYMVCVSIGTSSFGMSKIITLSSSIAIINKSTIEIEVIETISGTEQDDWKSIKPEEVIPFWSRAVEKRVLCVRYAHNRSASAKFPVHNSHRILLRMNDEDRPALHVEVTVTDFDGIYIVFDAYKIGDAPVLLVNCLSNQSVRYSQEKAEEEETQSEVLPPQHYVYYTWIDPFKLRQLSISCDRQNITVQLDVIFPIVSVLELDDGRQVFYAVFYDGPQTVLIFAENESVIEAVSGFSHEKSSSSELLSQYIELSLREIGISVINDITQDDLFYITINKSKEIWTETQQSLVRPLSHELNYRLEKNYKTHIKHLKANPSDKNLEKKKYHLDRYSYVTFDQNCGEITDREGYQVPVQRQVLDGLWIGYAWSASNTTFHLRINHIQIDDQLEYTMFPVAFHPIISKAAGTNIPGKPFIELSVFKTTVARSKRLHFRYFKLLIQEFAVCADQGLIVAILAFFKPDKKCSPLAIDMESDLKRIEKPLETFVKGQVENESAELKIYFDCIHFSPMKIHVSFSMHGSKPNDKLLVEYPFAEFLLELLNIAEVEDVVLKLNFYQREKDRFTIPQLTSGIINHYEHQLMKQIHVVILGLDVLGNPIGVIRGVVDGIKSFFYEPYKGATEGPREFIEGVASGTEHLVDSAIGGVAGAGAKVTSAISEGLATLTFDEDYENARIQRKELTSQTTSDVVQSGKDLVKDVVYGVKGVVKKPVEGAKEGGASGFVKGLGKGCLGLVTRPLSGVADLSSTSFNLIKRTATHEKVMHRIRHPRHVGRDGIVRPSAAYEAAGYFIFQRLDIEKYTKSDDYVAHINCSENRAGWLLATTKHLVFVIEKPSVPEVFGVEWHLSYKDLKGLPVVKFDPDQIKIFLKEPKVLGRTKKSQEYTKIITCQNIGDARYIVDKITGIMHTIEL